jgi:hypothetical protein
LPLVATETNIVPGQVVEEVLMGLVATSFRQRTGADTVGRCWLGACVTGFLVLCWLMRRFVADDAWISARYAENLARGHGFVWNPGGPRVEGFSNPLLVYIEALAHLLGLSATGTARVIGVACGVGLLVVIHRLGPDVVGRSATRIGMALTALYPPMALWAVGGLETLPTALATTTALLLLCRRDRDMRQAVRGGLVLGVLPWLRPEGIAIALAIAALSEGPGLLRKAERRAGLLRLVAVAGIPLASQAVLEAVRLVIYGHLVPNSVLYKSGSGSGSEVLLKFAEQARPVLVLGLAGAFLARGRQRLILVPPAVYAIGSIGTLDSVNSFSRFFMPTWPQWALLAGVAVAVASRGVGRLRVPAALAIGVMLVWVIVANQRGDLDNTQRYGDHYASCRDGARSDAAEWLRGQTIADTSFSISDSGLTPAQSGGRSAIDQFLLNDPLIQRTGALPVARRVQLVLDRDPDVLILTSRSSTHFDALYATDRSVTRDRRFRHYKLAHIAAGQGAECRYHLFMFQKSGRRPELRLAHHRIGTSGRG